MASNAALNIRMNVQPQTKHVTIDNIQPGLIIADADKYDGPYHVQPKLYEGQRLLTTGKLMINDVTVEEIRLYEVSNASGGKTVTIGLV